MAKIDHPQELNPSKISINTVLDYYFSMVLLLFKGSYSYGVAFFKFVWCIVSGATVCVCLVRVCYHAHLYKSQAWL